MTRMNHRFTQIGSWMQNVTRRVTSQRSRLWLSALKIGGLLAALTAVPVEASTLPTISVGYTPVAVAYDQFNGDLYVANYGAGTVSVIQGTTVTQTIPVGLTSAASTIERITSVRRVRGIPDSSRVTGASSGHRMSVRTTTPPYETKRHRWRQAAG